jgi:predicted metal-dependent phosphoesterase TrpH
MHPFPRKTSRPDERFQTMKKTLRTDFHTHTDYSRDGLIGISQFIAAARRAGLDRVAVTDHNTLRGALEAAALAPELIIIGEEIMTTEGELLGYYLQKEIPKGLTPEEAIARLRDQGAAISVSHPFDRLRHGAWKLDALRRILPLVDAVEGFNARCLFAEDNRRTDQFARENTKPMTAGSDAHIAFELGAAGLDVPTFHDAATLRAALPQAVVFGRLSPWWVHFFSTFAKWKKRFVGR